MVIPVLRIFNYEKAVEFYVEWLGFSIDWEHYFEPNMPVYMQVRHGEMVFHLSEHVGDCTPGAKVMLYVNNLDERLQQLVSKPYTYFRPGIVEQEWGLREMTLIDPFGNKLTFCEPIQA